MKREERGSLTVEAAIVLVIFIFGYASIVSVTSFIRAQMIIQHGITEAAREISGYCYIVSKTGLMDDSAALHEEAGGFKKSTDNVIDTAVKLYTALEDGSENITNAVTAIPANDSLDSFLGGVEAASDITQEEFDHMVSAANAMASAGNDYFSHPEAILKGLVSVAKDTGFSTFKSYVIAAPVSKGLFKKQIDLYGADAQGQDVLANLGVVGGLGGMNFSGSTLFNDGHTVTVQVVYTMKVPYPGFNQKSFHFIQTASTDAWGSHGTERPWRN